MRLFVLLITITISAIVDIIVMITSSVSIHFSLRWRASITHWNIVSSWQWLPYWTVLRSILIACVSIRRRSILPVLGILLMIIGVFGIVLVLLLPFLSFPQFLIESVFLLSTVPWCIIFPLISPCNGIIRSVSLNFLFEVRVFSPPWRVNLWIQWTSSGSLWFPNRLSILLESALSVSWLLWFTSSPWWRWFRCNSWVF